MKVSLFFASILVAASTASIVTAYTNKTPIVERNEPNPNAKSDPVPPANKHVTCEPFHDNGKLKWAALGLPLNAKTVLTNYKEFLGSAKPTGIDTELMASIQDYGAGQGSGITMTLSSVDVPRPYQSKFTYFLNNGDTHTFWLNSVDQGCDRDNVGFFARDVKSVQVYLRVG